MSSLSSTPGRPALAALAAGLVVLAGCGESQSTPSRPTPTPEAERPPARPAPSAPEKGSKDAEAPAPSSGDLRVADPAKLPGDPVPRYLPKGFVLPEPATVREGFGTPKPTNGVFYLEVEAPLDDLIAFLENEYKANGWKKITDQEIEEDGKQRANLLFMKGPQRTAGFDAQEDGSSTLVQVQYSNPPKP